MIFWLSNGEGLWRGRGQHHKPSVVGGVDFEIKIWQEVDEEMTGLPKNCQASPADN